MHKNLFILLLFIITNLTLSSCQSDDGQNIDITVRGKVTNENNEGVPNATLYIQRGKLNDSYGPTYYSQYTTVTTKSAGNYQYLVKDDKYSYKICCGVPSGYTSVEELCKYVDHTIKNSQTVPNIINFKLLE